MYSPDPDSSFLKDLEGLRQRVQENNQAALREVARLELRYAAVPALGRLKPLVPITLSDVFSVAPQVDISSTQSRGEQAVASTQSLGQARNQVAATHQLNLSSLQENQLILEALRKMLIEAGAPIGLDLSPLLKAMPLYFNDGFDDAVKVLDKFERGIARFRESPLHVGRLDTPTPQVASSSPAAQAPSLPHPKQEDPGTWSTKPQASAPAEFPVSAPRAAGAGAALPAATQSLAQPVPICRTADSGSIRRPGQSPATQNTPPFGTSGSRADMPPKTSLKPPPAASPVAHLPSVFNTRSGQRQATHSPTPRTDALTAPLTESPETPPGLARMSRVYSADNATPEKVLDAITRSHPLVRMSIWLTFCERGNSQFIPMLRNAVQEFVPQNHQGMGIKEELTVILDRADLEGVAVFQDLAFPVSLLSNNLPSSVKRDVEELIPLLLQ